MKFKKIFLCFIASLFTVLILVSCNGNVSVTGITISSEGNVREIQVDETLQLTATVFPENATDKRVAWSSSDLELASVNENGLVTGIAEGKVSIIASSVSDNEITQSFALVIHAKPVEVVNPTSVKITSTEKELKVGESMALTATVSPSDASQSVVWSSNDDTIAQVRGATLLGIKEGSVKITATCKNDSTIKDTISVTIVAAPASGDFLDMDFTSHADFMNAENGTLVKVKGIVTHVAPVSDSMVSYYIQNGVDGYYVYNQNASLYPVEVGKCYEVGGAKKYHQGNNEIVDVEYFKNSSENLTYTINDVTGKDVSSLDDMSPYHNSFIKGQAIITKTPSVSTKAYSVSVTMEGKAIDLRVEPKNMTEVEFNTIGAIFKKAIINTSLEFQGIMTAFGYGKASPQIQILKSSDLKVKEASPAEQLASIKGNLALKASLGVDAVSINLLTTVTGFEDVVITWSSDNTGVIDVATKKVTHLASDTLVTLTATLKHNKAPELTETKTFKVNVLGTEFNHEILVSLDCEDALDANSYGQSETKPSYTDKTNNDLVELGTPKITWLLRNSLIANDDKTEGRFGIRMQNNADSTKAGRIEVQQFGEYNFVQFDAAIFGNDSAITLGVEYLLSDTETWVDSGVALTLDSSLDTYRIALPEGSKRIAIYIIGSEGKRVNIDNIILFK
ncbi:MAG: Ig-like domain-containing protein [Anaeroplasmataceae bacterium]|nr:Ig-like domain-containing protein [Anaeroplasmataceae bacterium]